MDFSLNEEQRAWQLKARKFAHEEIRSLSLQRDRIPDPHQTFDWEIIKKGSKLGFRTLAVPKEWGGHGTDLVTQAVVMAELARGDSAICKTFSQCWKFSHLIAASCTRDQKERFLKPFLADDTYLLGTAGTEPNAGSDNRMAPDDDPKAGWKLRAEQQGDEWVLNGEKCFIANGSVAKLFFVHARTDPNAHIREGTTLFMVPSDTPGFRVGKVFNKRGWRFYQNAELIFENVRVPRANIVGEVNGGVKARADKSEFGDLELAANALGVCDAAVEMAMRHARAQTRGGNLLMEHQVVQLKLSEMHMLTEALRSFVMRTACERDRAMRGDETVGHSINNVLLINFATDVIQRVTHFSMDIHGAAGTMMMDARVEKLVRDAAIWTHLAGDSVQRIKGIKRLKLT